MSLSPSSERMLSTLQIKPATPLESPSDKSGRPIVKVGTCTDVGDFEVPLALLQALYLAPCFAPPSSPLATPNGSGEIVHGDSEASRPPISRSASTQMLRPQFPSPTRPRPPVLTSSASPEGVHFLSSRLELSFPPVRLLAAEQRRRILVSGGAGFVGSHLVDRLMCLGHDVIVLDNYFSGNKTAVSHWIGHPNFELQRHDVTAPFVAEVDLIYHLACPASPIAYQSNAVKTLKTNFSGTLNMLGLAKRTKARFLLSSTSEIYGSPEEHPQGEEYWGHVNCIGPRACYDEGKRVAEALAYGYHRQDGVDVRVARIFNTFGPRMSPSDGRFVSNFIMQALQGHDITIYGDGKQTRSLQYVHDLIDGMILLMESDVTEPVNLGNEDEATVEEWAQVIIDVVEEVLATAPPDLLPLEAHQRSKIRYEAAVVDDPPRRRPNISRARKRLGWSPKWTVRSGLVETVRHFVGRGLARSRKR